MKRLTVALLLTGAACAGNPSTMGLYTPIPQPDAYQAIERKVTDLGWTVLRSDTAGGLILAERVADTAGQKEELRITVVPDASGVTRLEITPSKVLPATNDRPIRRVAASGKTSADAHAILNLFMKAR